MRKNRETQDTGNDGKRQWDFAHIYFHMRPGEKKWENMGRNAKFLLNKK